MSVRCWKYMSHFQIMHFWGGKFQVLYIVRIYVQFTKCVIFVVIQCISPLCTGCLYKLILFQQFDIVSLVHYNDVIMSEMASQITSVSVVGSGADQRKYQSSASLAFCAGNSPVTGEFPAQRASNAENVSIWWRHHVETIVPVFLNVEHYARCYVNRFHTPCSETEIFRNIKRDATEHTFLSPGNCIDFNHSMDK